MSLNNYNDEQIEFVKDRLAVKTSPSQIINEFKQCFDGANATYQMILDIKRLFKDEIKKQSTKEMNNPNEVPIAHSRVRLEVVQKALEIAWQYKGIGSYPVTDPVTGLTTYKEKMDINHQAIKEYLKIAAAEEFMAKKLILEKLSRGITSSTPEIDKPGTPVVHIFTGHDEDGDEDETKLING